jgi:hypothetical protein
MWRDLKIWYMLQNSAKAARHIMQLHCSVMWHDSTRTIIHAAHRYNLCENLHWL